MASWRERWAWWREFWQLGAREVKKKVDGTGWAADKLREADRFLWWYANGLKILGTVLIALGVLATLLKR